MSRDNQRAILEYVDSIYESNDAICVGLASVAELPLSGFRAVQIADDDPDTGLCIGNRLPLVIDKSDRQVGLAIPGLVFLWARVDTRREHEQRNDDRNYTGISRLHRRSPQSPEVDGPACRMI